MSALELTIEHRKLLKKLMVASAKKGNLANAGLDLNGKDIVASAESWVISDCNATAHSERMLVELVGHLQHSNYTPGLTMISVVEPCVMCLSAASQAGYKELAYIIPARQYIAILPWMSDGIEIDKFALSKKFSNPISIVHLSTHQDEFCQVFAEAMRDKIEGIN